MTRFQNDPNIQNAANAPAPQNVQTQRNSPPIHQVRVGTISAAIWRREIQQDGHAVTQFSTRIQKRYRDSATNEYKTTEYYYVNDLPKLMLAAQKAYEFLSIKGEQDPLQIG